MRLILLLLLLPLTTKTASLVSINLLKPHIDIIPYQWFYSVCFLESSHHKELGLTQIKQPAINDINYKYGTHYTREDDKDYKKSFQMFVAYLHIYNKVTTLKSVVKTWRYGPYSTCKFLHRGYYIKLQKLIINSYMASKSVKPTKDDLKGLKVGKTFALNKSVLIEKKEEGYLLRLTSGKGIFQCKGAKSMIEYIKPIK